jgi:hypothetical protein
MAQIGGAFDSIRGAASTVAGKVVNAFTPAPSMAPISSPLLPAAGGSAALGYAAPAPAPVQQPTGNCTPKSDLSPAEMANATKHCKFALSALQYNDPKTVVDNLLQALGHLTE